MCSDVSIYGHHDHKKKSKTSSFEVLNILYNHFYSLI